MQLPHVELETNLTNKIGRIKCVSQGTLGRAPPQRNFVKWLNKLVAIHSRLTTQRLYHLRAGRERKYLRALGAPSWSTWLREPVQLGWPGLPHLQGLVTMRLALISLISHSISWFMMHTALSAVLSKSMSICESYYVLWYLWFVMIPHVCGPLGYSIAILCIVSKTFVYIRWSAQPPRLETCPATASALPAGQEVLGAAPKTHEAHGLRGLRRLSKSKTLSHSWKFLHGFTFHFLNLRTLVNFNILVASKASKLLSGLHEMAFIFIVTSYCMRAGRKQNFQLCVSWMNC